MSTVSYDSFLQYVLPFARSCPDVIARAAVRDACIAFCSDTEWWLHTFDPIDVQADVAAYDIPVPIGARLVRVRQLYYDGVEIKPQTPDSLQGYGGSDWRNLAGPPRGYTQQAPDEVILVPAPAELVEEALTGTVVVAPTRASTYCDASLLEHWAEVIGQGALARLHRMDDQPFTDPAKAAAALASFMFGCSEASRQTSQALTRGPLRVQMPRFV